MNSARAPEPTLLRSGDRVLIRPICREDKERLLDAFHRLSPESRFRRFFSPVPELSARQLRYLTEVDHRTHEALVADDPGTGEVVGVARFIRSTTDPSAAEVAIAVLDDWQGRGLGTALLGAVAARGREEGVEHFTASVLAYNAEMLDLFRRLGDTTVIDREADVVDLEIELPDTGIPVGLSQTIRAAAGGEVAPEPKHPAAPA